MRHVKFKYVYQKIVDLKQNQKTMAQWSLAAAMVKLAEEEATLTRLHSNRERCLEEIKERGAQSVTISELTSLQAYADYLEDQIRQKNQDVEHAQQNVRHSQSHLTNRLTDEKIWLRLREQAKDAFIRNELHKEQQFLDEIACNRFAAPTREIETSP
jgi:flagellar FliJ protein